MGAAADSMMTTERSADELADDMMSRGERYHDLQQLRGPLMTALVASITMTSGDMQEVAAMPWVVVAAVGSMVPTDGSADRVRAEVIGSGEQNQGLWQLRASWTIKHAASMTTVS